MIIKPFDANARKQDVSELNALLALPHISIETKRQIERKYGIFNQA